MFLSLNCLPFFHLSAIFLHIFCHFTHFFFFVFFHFLHIFTFFPLSSHFLHCIFILFHHYLLHFFLSSTLVSHAPMTKMKKTVISKHRKKMNIQTHNYSHLIVAFFGQCAKRILNIRRNDVQKLLLWIVIKTIIIHVFLCNWNVCVCFFA